MFTEMFPTQKLLIASFTRKQLFSPAYDAANIFDTNPGVRAWHIRMMGLLYDMAKARYVSNVMYRGCSAYEVWCTNRKHVSGGNVWGMGRNPCSLVSHKAA